MNPKSKTSQVPSVPRALEVLERIAGSAGGLTLGQLTRGLGYPRSSMHCLLTTLEQEGYVLRNHARGPYVAGARLITLSAKALPAPAIREKALPELRRLMRRTMLTVHLALPEGEQVALVVQLAPPDSRLVTFEGQRFGWHCTALGKAIAAHLPLERMQAMIARHALPPHNDQTIISPRKLSGDLELTRRRGYAIDDEEDVIGYRCLGAPVFDREDLPVAAISLMGTVVQITGMNVDQLAADLRSTAQRISDLIRKAP